MFRTDAERLERLEENIRLLRLRISGHTESKTFIVGGPITVELYIPPLFVAVDPDPDAIPESKIFYSVRGVLRVGTCEIAWMVDGTPEVINHQITAVTNEHPQSVVPPRELIDGNVIHPVIVAASADAADLAIAAVVTTRCR